MNSIKSTLTSLVGLMAVGSLAFAPLAYADNTNGNSAMLGASVDVNPSGHVTVRGATVTGVSGSQISATTSWGSESLSWSVGVGTSAQLTGKGGDGSVALTDVKNGDRLNFQGTLDTTASSLVVNARVVRDLSLFATSTDRDNHGKPERRHLEGKIQSINGTTIMVARGKKTFTVDVGVHATIENRDAAAVGLVDLKAGDRVRVTGTGTTTITASSLRLLSR